MDGRAQLKATLVLERLGLTVLNIVVTAPSCLTPSQLGQLLTRMLRDNRLNGTNAVGGAVLPPHRV